MNSKNIIGIGHRGASGHEPENTLVSIKKALELGAKWVEVDVYKVENRLIVFHDERLERTTNGHGYLSENTLKYLRLLDAGKGERIPFLEEVLDAIKGKANINIELKGWHTASDVAKIVNHYVSQDSWSYNNFLISSFNQRELKIIKDIESKIPIGVCLYGLPLDNARCGQELNAYSVHQSIDFIDEVFVKDAHSRGLKVFVYTVNEIRDIERMCKLNVDGIFSDFPERVLGVLHRDKQSID